MKICPNLSDPAVKEQWDSLANDPELGRFEAMREFMEADVNDRPIGTPEQVKEKLAKRFEVKPDTGIEADRKIILEKSNDPVYDDPQTLMGIAILSNPINGDKLSPEQNSKTMAMEVVRKLSDATKIDYQIVTSQEAAKITADSKNPYSLGKGPAFFYQGKVYFIDSLLSSSLAFHEFSHPIIRSLQISNPALFDKLYNSAIAESPELLTEALQEYSDLQEAIDKETNPENKSLLEQKYQNLVKEEVLVKALSKAAELKHKGLAGAKGFMGMIADLLYAIKRALRDVFGKSIDISKLDVDTSLDKLAEMLAKGGNFQIDTNQVSDKDLVAYSDEYFKYVEEMKNITDGARAQTLKAMSRRFYEGASQHINMLKKNKNYADLLNLFVDEYDRGDLQEIRSNVAPYAKELEAKAEELAEDIDRTNSQVNAVINSTLRIEIMMKKMLEHLKELRQDPENKDNVHKAYYYSHVLSYWQKYIAEAKDMMRASGADTKSPMLSLLTEIDEIMKRSSNLINDMNREGVSEVLWDQWKDIAGRAEGLFNDQIASLKKRNASQLTIDSTYKDFYGMNESEYKQYKDWAARKSRGESLPYEEEQLYEKANKAAFDGKAMSKEKIERALRGEGKDANWANSYLEGYLYNTDPVIGGFAKFFKNNMIEMEARTQGRENDILSQLEPLLKAAGINFTKIGELGKQIGFVDTIGYVDKDTKELVKKEVWTLLNPFKNYRYEVDKFNNEIKDLENRYHKSGNEEDKNALVAKLAEKNAHMRQFFQQEYVDEFYDKDSLLERDEIGQKASYERKKIFERMKDLSSPMAKEYDVLKTTERINQLWKEYRLLFSLYHANGEKKTGEDLEISKRLQEHREASRKFYEFKERPGVFQNALSNFEAETIQKLKEMGYAEDSSDFQDMFETYRDQWLTQNTRIVIKPEFYTKRTAILNRIKAITAKLPSAQANEINFAEYWKTILDVVSGYRDDDGQPIGSDLPDGRREHVMKAQKAMEDAKAKWAGFSGLTREEMDQLTTIAAKKNSGLRLTSEEFETYKEIINKQKASGLNEFEKIELNSLFAELRELQRKEPTEYYTDTINHWLSVINSEEVFRQTGLNEVDKNNVDQIINPKVLRVLFAESPEFEKWFNKNHIEKRVFDRASGVEQTVYERLYIWNVIKPNDESMYESTQVTKPDGTSEFVPGLPSLKYYARIVKKEYRTGYDPATGQIKRIVGIHKDNRDQWLPKQVMGSPYINEKYFELKNADPSSEQGKLFKVLENITAAHLKNQEGIGKRGKLYMDFPRYTKSGLEILQTKKLKQATKEKVTTFSTILKQIRDFFKGAKDQAGTNFNWKENSMLVRADAFDDQIENIPIQGLFNLGIDETSTDIITSMFRYMYAVEHHKQLVKMNPIATGIKKVLEDPNANLKEPDAINRDNFLNFGITTYLNKKGKYVRKDAFSNFYNREFTGETTTGAGKDWDALQAMQKHLFGRASFAFFALNFPSALKNSFGAKFQSLIHASAGNDISISSLARGEVWSMKYMAKLSGEDIYSKGTKSLEFQLGQIFDPIQGRFEEKFGTSVSRTLAKDIVSTGVLYNFRKWTEIQASMQTFGSMMYKKKIKVGDKEIDYMDAWELNKDGKIQLKPGIDPKWGITYDEEGNQIIGEEFKDFKTRIHSVMNKLNGAYSKFDQPEMQRYIAFRFISFLRRYFTTMAINRFGSRRWNPGYGEIDEGYYITAGKSLLKLMRSRNVNDMTTEDKRAWMRFTTEVGTLMLMSMLVGLMFGWDDDDEERFAKLRAKSGHLETLGTAENVPGEDYNTGGFMSLHLMNLMMQVRAENEQFIPFPKYGLDNLSTVIDLKSLAFGPTTDTYQQIGTDLTDIWTGDDSQFYKRRSGPYEWQQQGGRKLWAHIAKSFGVTGSNIDPAQAITNFQKAQNLSTRK